MKNINIDHKILAKHFNRTIESMRKLKNNYGTGNSHLWGVYVKAYNYDIALFEKEK